MKQPSPFLLAACTTILFALPAVAAETQLVTATGYGMNVEEAKKAAVRAAVESVVGTLVDAETLVENDELVRDKILSYSAGMVEDVKIVGEPTRNPAGLMAVPVRVKVKKTQLAERVKATIKTSAKIDGESLYQKASFNQENNKDAAAIMRKLFSPERMQGLLKFEPDIEGRRKVSVNQATGEVSVPFKGGINMEVYKQWTDEIIGKLGPMAKKKVADVVETINRDSDINLVQGQGLCILRSYRSGEVVGLKFDKEKWALLEKRLQDCNRCKWVVSVSLLDKTGETIKSTKMQLKSVGISPCGYNSFGIFPAYQPLPINRDCFFPRGRVPLGRLQTQELRDIDSVTVEVSVAK
jgi:hypothetical protein